MAVDIIFWNSLKIYFGIVKQCQALCILIDNHFSTYIISCDNRYVMFMNNVFYKTDTCYLATLITNSTGLRGPVRRELWRYTESYSRVCKGNIDVGINIGCYLVN